MLKSNEILYGPANTRSGSARLGSKNAIKIIQKANDFMVFRKAHLTKNLLVVGLCSSSFLM
jgi:hypothetical protein